MQSIPARIEMDLQRKHEVIEKIQNHLSLYAKLVGVPKQDLNKVVIERIKIEAIGALHICRTYKNLLHIALNGTQIRNKGCKFIVQAQLKQLLTLDLNSNQIVYGVVHLSKGDWKQLNKLRLGGNQIVSEGIQMLSKARWMELQQAFIYQNRFTYQAGNFFCLCDWPNLYNFHTCRYLSYQEYNWKYSQKIKIKSVLQYKFDKLKTLLI